jgi:hypothetical protein
MSANLQHADHPARPTSPAASRAAALPVRAGSRAAANAEAVAAIFAAFGKGDVPAILARLHEDVEWEFGYAHNSDIPWLTSGRGHDHVARFFQSLAGFRFDRFDVIDILSSDEWAVGLVALDTTWTATGGRIVEACEAVVWRFDATGLITAVRHAVDTRQHARALQAS